MLQLGYCKLLIAVFVICFVIYVHREFFGVTQVNMLYFSRGKQMFLEGNWEAPGKREKLFF